jgi:hypothetical protein
MPDIIIPEEKFEAFLRSLLVRVTKIQEELVAEMVADVELFRAQMNAGYERKVREAEEKIESMIRRAGEEIEREMRAVEEKLRAAEEEIARLLERRRHTVGAEREPES